MAKHAVNLKSLLIIFFTMLLVVGACIGWIDQALKSPITPLGIISFDFCGFHQNCELALKTWGLPGIRHALLSLGLDYLYLSLYTASISLSLILISSQSHLAQRKNFNRRFVFLAIIAGLCDATSNTLLIQVIFNEQAGLFAWWASLFACIKYLLLMATISWLLYLTLNQKSDQPQC